MTNNYLLLIAQFVGLNTVVYLYLLHIFNYNKQNNTMEGREMHGCHNSKNLIYLKPKCKIRMPYISYWSPWMTDDWVD